VSCTAPNRLVSRRAHWSNSLLETVTNQTELYLFQKHSNEFYVCARCGRMIIPLHVPLELMFFAVDSRVVVSVSTSWSRDGLKTYRRLVSVSVSSREKSSTSRSRHCEAETGTRSGPVLEQKSWGGGLNQA